MTQSRQPRGIPAGGEFAANQHDEAQSPLGGEPEDRRSAAEYAADFQREALAELASYVQKGNPDIFIAVEGGHPDAGYDEDLRSAAAIVIPDGVLQLSHGSVTVYDDAGASSTVRESNRSEKPLARSESAIDRALALMDCRDAAEDFAFTGDLEIEGTSSYIDDNATLLSARFSDGSGAIFGTDSDFSNAASQQIIRRFENGGEDIPEIRSELSSELGVPEGVLAGMSRSGAMAKFLDSRKVDRAELADRIAERVGATRILIGKDVAYEPDEQDRWDPIKVVRIPGDA